MAMTARRAARCLEVLGWSQVELARRLNRVAGTRYAGRDVWKWVAGARPVPGAAAVFLRLSIRLALLERQLERERRSRAV